MPLEERQHAPGFLFDTVSGRLWGYKAADGTEIPFVFGSTALAVYGTAPGLGGLGFPYLATFAGAGGTGPYTYSIVGTAPPGLTIGSSTGVLSGTLATPGSFTFQVRATDATSATATSSPFTVLVTGGRPALGLNGIPITTAVVGLGYSVQFLGSGGTPPYTYALTGTLPAGLAFNTSTGLLSGTPTTVQTATGLRVSVTDSASSSATVQGSIFQIAVAASAVAPAFTSAPAIVGTPQEGVAAAYTTGVATGAPTPTLSGVFLLDGVSVGASYTPVTGDAGKALAYRQTATNGVGSPAVSTSASVTIIAAASGPDTRPRYWYGPATDYTTGTAAAFNGATPLTSSSNGGKTGSFASTASGTQYIWLAALQSAGPITVTEPLGQAGFNGAGQAGDWTGAETSPSVSTTTYVDSTGTYLLYRSNYRGISGVTFTLV